MYVGIGVLILIVTLFVNIRFSEYQARSVEERKEHMVGLIESEAHQVQNRYYIVADSITSFYLGSQLVEPHEFQNFNKKLLATNPLVSRIQHVFVVQNGTIIQSYPEPGFGGKEIDSLFPSYLVDTDGVETILLEFAMDPSDASSPKIIIAIPADILLAKDVLPGRHYKAVVTSAADNRILYEIERRGDQEVRSGVEFSSSEKQNSITVQKPTRLLGHNAGGNLTLSYIVWSSVFESQLSVYEQIMLFAGLGASFLLPLLLIRTQRLAERVQRINKELRKIDKAKDEFSSMITHELKTPLIPIIGYSDLLLDGTLGEVAENQKEKIQIMRQSARRLSQLIQDILDAHKLELGKMRFEMQDVSSGYIIEQCINEFRPLAEAKHIKLIGNAGGQDVTLRCDQKRILQVLGNLVNNAIKFVSENTGRIEITARSEGEHVIFSVKDNGVGIPKEKQPLLFVKFYQVDTSLNRKSGGTGLGLAICKGIVEAHKGRIWVESEEGRGTTVYFSIPVGGKEP